MNNDLLKINPLEEKKRIINFLESIFERQHKNKAIIGISGGIDSATSFTLLTKILKPEDIIIAHMYYFESKFSEIEKFILEKKIPEKNIFHMSIKKPVDAVAKLENISVSEEDKIRLGNISARVRMIILYDLAKKYNALVCGTENKSENLLGYFTRFGDQASDIEPIGHLYKTQVFQLAKYLGIPKKIIDQAPTAGLWQGQTDEGQFGFTYQEADQVLYLHFEKKELLKEIEKKGYKNAKKILEWNKNNLFKHQTPYTIK